MSESTRSTTETATERKRDRLKRYLAERVEEEGELYVKSKFIADDVGYSPRQIGMAMAVLRDSDPDLEVERWSYTNATTWRVAPA